MRLVWIVALLSPAASAQGGAAPRWTSVPADTVRWEVVSDSLGRRVYIDAETVERGETVVEVWTWHAYAEARQPPRGAAYDWEISQDRVFCALQMTAPLQVARYLGGERAGAFMYPPEVGPYGWAPGSTAEAVGERVCAGEAASGR